MVSFFKKINYTSLAMLCTALLLNALHINSMVFFMYGQRQCNDYNAFKKKVIDTKKNENIRINEQIKSNSDRIEQKSLLDEKLRVYKNAQENFDKYSTIEQKFDNENSPYEALSLIRKKMQASFINPEQMGYQENILPFNNHNNARRDFDRLFVQPIKEITQHINNLDTIFKAILYKNMIPINQNNTQYSNIEAYNLPTEPIYDEQSKTFILKLKSDENNTAKDTHEENVFFGEPEYNNGKITNTNTQFQYVGKPESIVFNEKSIFAYLPIYHYLCVINRMQNAIKYLKHHRESTNKFKEKKIVNEGDIAQLEGTLKQYGPLYEVYLPQQNKNLTKQLQQNQDYIDGKKSLFFPLLAHWFGFGKK